MRTKLFHLSLILITALTVLMSCQKDLDGGGGGVVIPTDQYPKVGTTWTYNYEWYNSPGGATNLKIVRHRAKTEETLGGEKWLRIVDVETDTTVYFLKTKTDGLYQYTNSNPYILCKYPAAVNDTYTTFNGGATENFTVRGVNDSLPTGIGSIPLSKYEGVKTGYIIDVIWYNKNVWIVWKNQYKLICVPPFCDYYLYSRLFLDNIVY